MKGRSWRTNCPLVLAACHKLGQGDCVCSLHELNKNAHVGEGQGQTKAFPNFLCIWTGKEQMFFILYLPQVVALTKLRFPQLNIVDITQVVFAFIRHTLEAQTSCLYANPDLTVGKELSNESQPHIILHFFYTQHCVGET